MGYLVTGSKGFIGRNLISYMKEKGINYSIDDFRGKDTIIHLSAATNVRKSIKDPWESFEKNTKETFNLLYNSVAMNVPRFIFASSMGVTNPYNPYLASKAAGEAYCKAFKESYGINTHIARFSNVYGPCSEFKDSVIAKFIKATMHKQPFHIFGDGTQTRDFVYVGDVVRSLLSTQGEISYITSGTTTSLNSVLNYLIDLSHEFFNYVPNIKHIAAQPGEIINIRDTQGIHNPTPLYDGLKDTYKWFAEHQ